MSRRLVVRPQARLELADACDWYDAHDKGLGDELIEAFVKATQSIAENPFQYQTIRREYRRVLPGKYPFCLIYAVRGDDVVVFSCFH